MKHEGLHSTVGRPRSESELAGIALHILLQTQTAHLQEKTKQNTELWFSQDTVCPLEGAKSLLKDSTVPLVSYLDAVLVQEAWQREALLLVEGLAKDDQLLKEEDSPLLHPAKHTTLWVRHHEGVLQQKAALSHDLPLERDKNQMELEQSGGE